MEIAHARGAQSQVGFSRGFGAVAVNFLEVGIDLRNKSTLTVRRTLNALLLTSAPLSSGS